jgi:hydantoinase/carbamoylase family amidase
MTINPNRIAADIEAIAAFTETPGAGHSRPTFSAPWLAARDYMISEAQRAGCAHRIDAAGNIHVTPTAVRPEQKRWLSGSHIDSVPNGGKFDGVTGIVVPLEILRAAHEASENVNLELIVFAEEEGTTFNLGMLGSRTWCGTLKADQLLNLRNKHGQNYIEAGQSCGVDPARFAAERINPNLYHGLIEVHVEQGPAMWELNQPIAIVTAINGRRQYAVRIEGEPNHAGSTPMDYRKDALAAAAECALAVEHLAMSLPRQTVATVGRFAVSPNAINVINGTVEFTVDLRSDTDTVLASGDAALCENFSAICAKRSVKLGITQTESLPAMQMDAAVLDRLRRAARDCKIANPVETSSGALHDAAIVAPFLPTAMLFVASKDGISHNPAEFSRIEDIALAAEVLARAIA